MHQVFKDMSKLNTHIGEKLIKLISFHNAEVFAGFRICKTPLCDAYVVPSNLKENDLF